jgi:hypothetical protein
MPISVIVWIYKHISIYVGVDSGRLTFFNHCNHILTAIQAIELSHEQVPELTVGDPSSTDTLPVKVANTLPRSDGFQMRRLFCRNQPALFSQIRSMSGFLSPLSNSQPRVAHQSDASIAPGLRSCPFYGIITVLAFLTDYLAETSSEHKTHALT